MLQYFEPYICYILFIIIFGFYSKFDTLYIQFNFIYCLVAEVETPIPQTLKSCVGVKWSTCC